MVKKAKKNKKPKKPKMNKKIVTKKINKSEDELIKDLECVCLTYMANTKDIHADIDISMRSLINELYDGIYSDEWVSIHVYGELMFYSLIIQMMNIKHCNINIMFHLFKELVSNKEYQTHTLSIKALESAILYGNKIKGKR